MNFTGIKGSFGLALIVGGNLVPLYGIIAWGWDIFSVFFLYWVENVIIGFYVLIMMAVHALRIHIIIFLLSLFKMAFFVFHYGMFCMVHLAILTGLFAPEINHGIFEFQDLINLFQTPKVQGFYYAIAGIAIAQAFESFQIYITRFSNIKKSQDIMGYPYGRIVVLHLAILFGGFLVLLLGQPIWALAVLIALKTSYDVITSRAQEKEKNENFYIEAGDDGPQKNS